MRPARAPIFARERWFGGDVAFLKKLKASLGLAPAAAHGKPGARAYAIGDVHGCDAALAQLLAKVEADIATHRPCPTHIVFLGDLIDRGPASRAVIERLIAYKPKDARVSFLMGNHEEFLLRALDGEPGILGRWLEYGGREFCQSYGLAPERLIALEEPAALALLRQAVPDSHRRFIKSFADTFRFGDYVFVHAGIRPGLPLDAQQAADLRWIRDGFLDDAAEHGFIVVHGHTITDEPVERANRIGIDTGAYRGGALTALVIDNAQRRWLRAKN